MYLLTEHGTQRDMLLSCRIDLTRFALCLLSITFAGMHRMRVSFSLAEYKMNEIRIRDRLVEHGETLFRSPPELVRFTQDDEANHLLNDLTDHPHAFVLASVMDRQIKAERAWLIPYRFMQKIGSFSMDTLVRQSQSDVQYLMSEPEPLHRFVDTMSDFFFKAVRRIADQYQSDASRIWQDKPSSATVVYRFLEFDGVGPKIATMAANILAREFKIEFADHYSIDISADVHVRRVFGRLGLTPHDATVDQLIFRARGLHPEFPGLMDFPAWEIGRRWCRPKKTECSGCYMKDLCPSANGGTANIPMQAMPNGAPDG